MRLEELMEQGRIVVGVNTTVDVAPNEITTQAAKWRFKVDKGGIPVDRLTDPPASQIVKEGPGDGSIP
ncbi:MAG: hypothetical protein EOP83_12140 [Verrucomicrobiaceae bacterium]|nr:MAG: hypothetical protein EOP83_12140 [Verrucomicrobiaceae bacterium]